MQKDRDFRLRERERLPVICVILAGHRTVTIMERVLAAVELLELILLEVDIQTVLTSAIRTCHFWKDVIRDSPRLQASLFFRPERLAPTGRHGRIEARVNPLLLKRFEDLLSITANNVRSVETERILRPEASWRTMLIQQPPAVTVGVWKVDMGCYLEQGFENATENLNFAEEGGVRMERLVEYAGSLERGYTWSMLWGEEGKRRLETEKNSLFFRKARISERRSLVDMWRDSDMVVKLTRWSTGAR